MAKTKRAGRLTAALALAGCGLIFVVLNFTQFWTVHDLTHEAVDSKSHVDMETQLRANLQNRAAGLAMQLKEERDKLLNTLAELQAGSANQLADRAVENQPKINAVKEFFEPPVTSTVTPLPSVHPVPVAPRQQVGVSPNGRAPATGGESQHPYVGTLPGASKHPILNYNDEQLKQTQINDMISLYALTTGRTPGVSCDSDFGMGLVHRWREAKAEYCSADAARVGTVGGKKSEIDCYLVKQTRHGGNGDQICVMENVGVNMDIFNDDKIMYNTVRSYEATKHRAQPYVKFPSDFIKAACKPNPDKWKPSLMPGWNNDWTVSAVKTIAENEDIQCHEWIEEPVLIDQRDTFANLFHDSEDFVNVFLAMAVLELTAGDTQIYLTDLYPEGPFWDIWKKPFGVGHKPLTAWDLKKRFGHSDSDKRTTCFRKLIVGIYGPASPLTVCSWDTNCKASSLVRAYSDFVIRGMGLQSFSHYAAEKPSREVHIVYMARRSSAQWPEKKFCDDENSFFLCEIWSNWGLRSLQRTMKNEELLLGSLRALEKETFHNGAKVMVRDVDFNLLTFEDQIKVDLQADIMIGPHGAGLMHSLFMRDRAALIELFVDGSSANRHFHNMALWYGRTYAEVGGSTSPEQVLPQVRRIIAEMNLDSY